MRKYTRYNAQSFNDAMICTIDSIRKYMLEIILHQQRTLHLLKQKTLMQTQEDHSHQTQAVNSDSLKVDLVVKQNSCSKKEDSNSETASSKSAKECSLNSETQDVHAIKYKMSKAKERCMAYFRSLHSHLQVLSKDDLKGTRIEHGFKRAFMSLFVGQQHTEQPEIINEGRVDQYPEKCQVKSPMLDSSPDNQTTKYSKQSLESENILLKGAVA
ncbi:hypothetical protein Tco_0201872 [Tanacetum coccineum]